jgi:CheY-like chemotaxis protein
VSEPDEIREARELARALTAALERATRAGAGAGDLAIARDVAQMLSLGGLDRALVAVARRRGGAPSAALKPVLERLSRLGALALEAGTVAPFERADAELAGLASVAEEGAAPADGGAPAALPELPAGDVVDLPRDADDRLRRTRLSVPVAGSLRATLDWLSGGDARSAVRVAAEDSMLEVWLAGVDPAGLRPASEVLAAVDGNLGPVGPGAPAGTWRVRVPAHAARPSYLMLEQGGLRLALPWHAVLHVHMVPVDEAKALRPEAPWLDPLAGGRVATGERPVVMVAHGLRRAWIVADRLVWRFPAEPWEPASSPPAAALSGMVRTEEGETWWRVDVARLLADVEPIPVPDLTRRPAAGPARATPGAPAAAPAPAARSPLPAAPLPPPRREILGLAPAPAPEPRRAGSAPLARAPAADLPRAGSAAPAQAPSAPPAPRLLGAEEVEPLPAPPGALDATSVEALPLGPPASGSAGPAVRRALIADDSITARLFLTRLLEQHGFQVEGVATAAQLVMALAQGPWTLVFLDLDLPDARGAAMARGVRERLARLDAAAVVVGLVRDAEDALAAREAALEHRLRKPFDEGELRGILARLGLAERA